jgi:hypothetical protein
VIEMADVFPTLSTISLREAEGGSIVGIPRHDGVKLVLVADRLANGVRSFVWLNPNFQDRPSAIFAENWRNESSVLQYGPNVRFELGTSDDELDPTGRNSWEAPGVIVSLGGDLFIRAAPDDEIYGRNKLVNVRNGAVHSTNLPDTLWTFLSWQLRIRDPLKHCDIKLTEFRLTTKRRA